MQHSDEEDEEGLTAWRRPSVAEEDEAYELEQQMAASLQEEMEEQE